MKNKTLLLLLLAGIVAGCHLGTSKKDKDDYEKDTPVAAVVGSAGIGVYNLDSKTVVKTAQLNLEAGGIVIDLSETTGKLFNAVATDTTRKFVLSQGTTDSAEVVNFIMKQHAYSDNNDSTGVSLRLNSNPQWGIKAKVAAAKCDFDLSKLKISKFLLTCAAGELRIKLRPVLANTAVEINASVSDLTISIPQNAACEVYLESALADNDLTGFQKIDENRYETADFASAKNKIHIKANCSLSSFKVVRY